MALTGRALSIQRDKERRAKLKQKELDKPLPYPNPVPTVAGASTSGLNAAQMGGASGIGFEDTATQDAISTEVETAANAGVPKSGAGSSTRSGGGAPSMVNAERASFILSGAGLTGIIKPEKLIGMTTAQAQRMVAEQKAKQGSQVTAGTSAVYNPETVNKTKRAIDAFGFALNKITKDPFNGKQSKLNKTESLITSTQKQLAKLFKTPEEFQNAYATNQTFREAIDNFQKMGGKADGVTSSIVAPANSVNIVKDIDNGDGTRTVTYSDGTTGKVSVTKNADGTESYTDITGRTQDTATYLSTIKNPEANQTAQQAALDELIPERDIQQQEISRLAGIPKELQKLYFGDENEIGLLQQKKAEAEEEKRIIEREEKNAQSNLKAQAKLAIQKNNAEMQIQTAQVEENRLAAKNYMTGYLAKLGALNTTGAAGLAIQTLDTKYQIQKQTLETNAKYDNQTIELKLSEALNTIETDTDRDILKIQQDLTKTTEDVFKEVTKAQQEADKEIARISLSYAKTLREKTDDYVKKQKAEAEKYAKEYAKIASGGLDLVKLNQSIAGGDVMEGQYVPKKGVLLPNGKFAKIALTPAQQQDVEAAGIVGLSNIRYFNNLPPAVRELIIRDKVENGGNYNVTRMAEVLKSYQDDKKTKETGDADTNIFRPNE